MANGTIAFDTLQTSDAKRSGTTKCVDTSYVYNGVLKLWINGTLLSGANTINESINVGSVTDNGTGDLQLNFTSSFANVNYSAVTECANTSNTASNSGSKAQTYATGSFNIVTTQNGSGADIDDTIYIVAGDLA